MKRYYKFIALVAAAALIALAACACSVRRIDAPITEKPESEKNVVDASGSSNGGASTDGTSKASSSDAPAASTDKQTEKSADTTEAVPDVQTEAPAPATDKETENTANAPAQTEAPQTTQAGAGRNVQPTPASADETFDRTVFVGDSICSGFRVYGVMPANNCLAVGNVGARSIFDYTFAVDGVEYDLVTAIKLVNPSFVVFSMGMNDINITDEQTYCSNYDNIISQIHAAVPDAKLFVASITPTYNAPSFTNARIDSFNAAIKAHLEGTGYYYIDVNSVLKDASTNSLYPNYHSGDGIHLSPEAYEIFKSTVYSYFQSIGVAS